ATSAWEAAAGWAASRNASSPNTSPSHIMPPGDPRPPRAASLAIEKTTAWDPSVSRAARFKAGAEARQFALASNPFFNALAGPAIWGQPASLRLAGRATMAMLSPANALTVLATVLATHTITGAWDGTAASDAG